MMPKTSVRPAASSGVASATQRAVSVRGSSLSRMSGSPGGEQPAHPLAEALAPRLFSRDHGREAAAADRGDAVRDREQLVEILGHDEDRGAGVAQRDERAMD